MAVTLRRSLEFERDSPVTRYWLANCVGFAVVGGVDGVVEDVVAELDPSAPETLVVRCGRRRTRSVPAYAVASVVPAQRVLVVDRVPGPVAVHGREFAGAAGRGLRAGGSAAAILGSVGWTVARRGAAAGARGTGTACVAAGVLAGRGWRAGSPVAAELGRRGASRSVRLLRSVPWRSFVRSARSGTTSLRLGLWRGSSRLRTTWSRTSSGRSS